MKYIYALLNYMKTEKAKHDILDYARAVFVIAAVIIMALLIADLFRNR